ncbi:hypothetical protein Aspvir_008327 [Aspergillus viridinutans]|uniref:Uncharacterized protein n=1 Tax=Aspergillus viridinutans TaxID=75553 RepID=A0A9P3C107_ASPVI|nr:uncharacterized protein Aspvir_008327 [Aspergillus viridinutans]GIK04248.1 hypothetical protein Aspvir_008327 [Aspergillus viridinutans]
MPHPPLNIVECRAVIRYKPCLIFNDNEVPYVIWFEDALLLYGVPTVLFDLYILVLDIDIAADYLIKAGWTVDTQSPRRVGNAEVKTRQQRLMTPDSQTTTVLLLASDWKFPLTDDSTLERLFLEELPDQTLSFPSLSGFLDALIETWLDSDDDSVLLHLAVQINYLYGHAPALKERSFANQMKYEHRQFHFDVLAGMSTTLPFRKHQRGIRDALLQGRYELQECSAPRDNDDFFNPWKNVRLPPPPES